MKELEHTHCEVKKIVDLQYPNWADFSSSFDDDDENPVSGTQRTSITIKGGFLEDTDYAWSSSGAKLIVFNTKTGANISTWTFKQRISCVSPFPNQPGQLPLLLVGTDNDATKIKESIGTVCIFDCTISQVLHAIKLPSAVEQLCIINGGAEWEDINEKRINTFPIENHNGIACITLKSLDHLMIDLRRNEWDNPSSFPAADESNPARVDFSGDSNNLRHKSNCQQHSAFNLMNDRIERYIGFNRDEFESSALYQESLTTVLTCSRKIGCLISGCLGRVIIWQNDGVVRWISPAMEDNLIVSHLALLEPTDDPRPFCYLWAAYQQEDALVYPPILRMYAMLFERKCCDKGINFYFNLEGEPSLKFELDLEEKCRIISLFTIIRESSPEQTESGNKRGEDSLLLINTDEKSFLFDLNQWYKEQMPRFSGECQNIQAILSSYLTKSEASTPDNIVINVTHVPSTLKDYLCTTSTPPEEFFYPNSLSFEWMQLGTKKIVTWLTRGVQAQLLREIVMSGPIVMIQPSEIYHRCIAAGLIPFNTDLPYNNDLDSQRDAILTLCLEQRWTTFLLRCANEWSDGSAAYLYPAFLRWSIQRASTVKLNTHKLCIPLFDHSGSSIGEAEIKTLRFFSQQMECLCNVVDNLSAESAELEQQKRALYRISMYLSIMLWFYDVGLLPETQEVDEDNLPISFLLRIPYPADKLAVLYKEKREELKKYPVKKVDNNEEHLFIDELITRECPALRTQWEQESNEIGYDGQYPPPSLQSLLRSCLTDCYQHPDSNEMENKHQIIIYLLMDLVMLLQAVCQNVDQLIKYPSAFKQSPGLIKLTQALFLLDHEDYQGFIDIITGQLVFDSDIKEWHHKLIMRSLLRSNQNKLALIYLRVRKPPLSSIEEHGTVVMLSVERGLVQSAFHRRPPSHYTDLLIKFFRACKTYGKLNDIMHLALDYEEEEAFIRFLEQEKCEETRLLYYLQRCRYTEASNVFGGNDPSMINLQRNNNKPASLTMFHAYNATLPDISRRFTANFIRREPEIDAADSRYPRPMSHKQSRQQKTREIYETAIKKARETFIRRRDRSRIPFLSAPCSSLLRPTAENTDTNCVLFVERTNSLGKKRSFEEIRDGELTREERLNIRKRQKTNSDLTTGRINNSVGKMDSMCDTPLIKKKSHSVNVKESLPVETPQSILKIRQLIRDSASPSGRLSTPIEDEKEKKPRQIRFSINQPKNVDSSVDEMAVDNEEIDETENSNKDENMETIDIDEQDTEDLEELTNSDLLEDKKEPKCPSVSPQPDEPNDSETYFSPSDSTKSINATPVLSDNSSITTSLSQIVSGPKPRAAIRRSNMNDTQNDMSRKSMSFIQNTSADESIDYTVDAFLRSNVVSSTFIDGFGPMTPKTRARLSSFSHCASAVLTPNSSIELLVNDDNNDDTNKNETKNESSTSYSSTSDTLSTKNESSLADVSMKDKNNVKSFRYSLVKTSIRIEKNVVEEVGSDEETEDTKINDTVDLEDENTGVQDKFNSIEEDSEVAGDEVDENKDVEMKSETRKEFDSAEIQEIHEVTEEHQEVTISLGESSSEVQLLEHTKDAEVVEHVDVKLEETMDVVQTDVVQVIEYNEIVIDDDKQSLKASDDYEEELMALKYDDDDNDQNDDDDDQDEQDDDHNDNEGNDGDEEGEEEEVFESLQNTMEIEVSHHEVIEFVDDSNEQQSDSESLQLKLSPKKSSLTKIVDDNITDDDSSRSMQENVLEEKMNKSVTTNASQATTVPISDVAFTDDETDDDSREGDVSENSGNKSELSREHEESNDVEKTMQEEADDQNHNDVEAVTSKDQTKKNKGVQKASKINDSHDSAKLEQSDDGKEEKIDVDVNEKIDEDDKEEKNEDDDDKEMNKGAKEKKDDDKQNKKDDEDENDEEISEIDQIKNRKRASSVAPTIPNDSNRVSPDIKSSNIRNRRATSLAKEVFSSTKEVSSPIQQASTPSPEPSSPSSTPGKCGRPRRSVSLIKEVLTPTRLPDPALENISEVPIRRTTRRAASVQKEILAPGAAKTPTKNVKRANVEEDTKEGVAEKTETPRKVGRPKKSASVSTDGDNLSDDKTATVDSDTPRKVGRPKKDTSVSKDVVSEAVKEETPKKLGRPRKEKVSESMEVDNVSNTEDELVEKPVTRKVGRPRKATSESLQADNSSTATEDELIEKTSVKRVGRGRRAASVTKDLGKAEIVSKKATRAASVAKEIDDNKIIKTSKRGRTTSTSSEVAQEIAIEKSHPVKRTKTSASASSTSSAELKEAANGSVNESKPARKTRAASVAKEEEPVDDVSVTKRSRRAASVSEDEKPVKDVPVTKRSTRAGSVAKDEEPVDEVSVTKRSRRAASVSEDEKPVKDVPVTKRSTRAASVAKDEEPVNDVAATKRSRRAASVAKDEEYPVNDVSATKRSTRAASVSKEITEELPRKTRGTSVPKEDPKDSSRSGSVAKEVEATVSRSRRAASIPKEAALPEESSSTAKRTRAGSVSKDAPEDNNQATVKRVVRRRGSNKETDERTRKTSVVDEVIPEEDDEDNNDGDDENENIFDKKVTRRRVTAKPSSDKSGESLVNNRKTRAASITAIPEEVELSDDSVKTSGRGRMRRAMSVDIPATETKRRTRGLAKSAISEEDDEETHQMEIDTEMKSNKKMPTRRKRAASETKDVNSTTSVRSSRRIAKGSQKKNDADEEEDQTETIGDDDVFSPPSTGSNAKSSSQPNRRPIVSFISPLSEEEKKAAMEIKIQNIRNDSKKIQRHKQPVFIVKPLGIRKAFVIQSELNIKKKTVE